MADKRVEVKRRQIPARLRQVRGERSQRGFAAEIGVFQQNINRYERGEALPGVDFLVTLALSEGISLDWFLLGEGPMRRRR